MSSAVDICNQALLMLGSLPIISFDDETVESSSCKTLYPTAKAQVLRSYPWRCATVVETLALRAESPVDPSWQYSFAIPDDSLRVLEILQVTDSNKTVAYRPPWAVEGKSLMCNDTNIAARYIKNIAEPQLDVHVEMALVGRIAVDLSYTLTASSSREAQLQQMFDLKLNEARITDRQEASHTSFKINKLDAVRR